MASRSSSASLKSSSRTVPEIVCPGAIVCGVTAMSGMYSGGSLFPWASVMATMFESYLVYSLAPSIPIVNVGGPSVLSPSIGV